MTEKDWLYYENLARQEGYTCICGVDEAGRGPLAGPVVAAAVILPPGLVPDGINDSKKLTAIKRDLLYDQIKKTATCYCIVAIGPQTIDQINILEASLLAMRKAVEGLKTKPDYILVDGNQCPRTTIKEETVVKGDSLSASIAAASILAKVYRDRMMEDYNKEYPQYQFAKHKGYPTALHYQMLFEHGPCKIHRKEFLKNLKQKQTEYNQKIALGKQGEEAVCHHLQTEGYQVVARNYHSRYGELDVIAQNEEYLLFVEVKTRSQNYLERPALAVTPAKQAKLVKTAESYLQSHETTLQPRFDVAEVWVEKENGPAKIEYTENAFGTKEPAY